MRRAPASRGGGGEGRRRGVSLGLLCGHLPDSAPALAPQKRWGPLGERPGYLPGLPGVPRLEAPQRERPPPPPRPEDLGAGLTSGAGLR